MVAVRKRRDHKLELASIRDRKLFDAEERSKLLASSLKRAHRDLARSEMLLGKLTAFRDAPRKPPKWAHARPARIKGARSPEVPVAPWADWHVGEVVESAEVNGYNSYNMKIFEERVQRLVGTTIRLCKQHHVSGAYPGIVVPLVGDFVSGGLHPELLKTDEEEILPVTLRTEEVLIWAITEIANEFGRVYLPSVAGNHGRNTAKPEFKRYLYKNFDWLIYRHLARHFAADTRVRFDIRPTNDVAFSVYGVRYLLAHGDMLGVKGGDGIIGSIGPITRGEVKKSGQASALNQPFDKLIIGHWHQRLWLPRATVAGTLKGFDEYARLQLGAKPDRPTQPLWFVHPSNGETAHWDIYVDEKPETAREWISWQAE
jgi:hypothetical protein